MRALFKYVKLLDTLLGSMMSRSVKIIGIAGSPRRNGNTEILVREALDIAQKEGAEVELVSLANKTIMPCDDCKICLKDKNCHIKDDLEQIFGKMLEADGIILATPVYVGGMTPNLKSLIDRSSRLLWAKDLSLKGKLGGAIAVGGIAGQLTTYMQVLMFLVFAGVTIVDGGGWPVAQGWNKGDVLGDKKGMNQARELGKNIAMLATKIR
jgi:multimeric flavodoxin WrbA